MNILTIEWFQLDQEFHVYFRHHLNQIVISCDKADSVLNKLTFNQIKKIWFTFWFILSWEEHSPNLSFKVAFDFSFLLEGLKYRAGRGKELSQGSVPFKAYTEVTNCDTLFLVFFIEVNSRFINDLNQRS